MPFRARLSQTGDLARCRDRCPGRRPGELQGRTGRSRARGQAAPLSDWDFAVTAPRSDDARDALPETVRPLRPVAAQWDRLSPAWCYMLILAGPVKVDLLSGHPHQPAAQPGDRFTFHTIARARATKTKNTPGSTTWLARYSSAIWCLRCPALRSGTPGRHSPSPRPGPGG